MLCMMHYDAVYSPTPGQMGITPGSKKPSQKGVVNQAQHLAYLESNPYDAFTEDDMQNVCYLNKIIQSEFLDLSKITLQLKY